MTYPLVKLVDAPTVTANVRADLNSDIGAVRSSVSADGFSLGAPTLDVDPGMNGGVYGYRSLSLTVRFTGPKDAALLALGDLSRELLRRDNWLLFQLDAVREPVWYYVYQSPPTPLSLDQVYVEGVREDVWQITLTLTADAFSYGIEETLGPVTVTQSPSGSRAMRWELPTIKGDAPAALRVKVATNGNVYQRDSSWLIGCVSSDETVADALMEIGSGDGFTETGDTSATPVPSDRFFAGSYRQIDLSSSTLETRLQGSLPQSLSGRYKVLLRTELTSNTTADIDYQARLGISTGVGDPVSYGQTVITTALYTATSAGFWRGWINLGDFNFPAGTPELRDVRDPAESTIKTYIRLDLAASTTGQARIDSLKFIPVDPRSGSTRILSATFPTRGIGQYNADGVFTRSGVFDGESELFWAEDAGNGALVPSSPWMTGGYPTADPGATNNVLFVMATSRGGPAPNLPGGSVDGDITHLDAPCEVTVVYQPRRLNLPGDRT